MINGVFGEVVCRLRYLKVDDIELVISEEWSVFQGWIRKKKKFFTEIEAFL